MGGEQNPGHETIRYRKAISLLTKEELLSQNLFRNPYADHMSNTNTPVEEHLSSDQDKTVKGKQALRRLNQAAARERNIALCQRISLLCDNFNAVEILTL